MNGQKRKHAIEIAGLILLTILVILVVISGQKKGLLPHSSQAQTQLPEGTVSIQEVLKEETEQPESLTEWLPVIEYDDYTPSEIEQMNFYSTVILGNSQAQALRNFGLVKNADFVTKVGLSINRVLSDPDGAAPIEQLYGKSYSKAVFVFGENELGWPYPENFIKIYKRVIDRVRSMNPGVKVYVQAIFPVTKEVSEKSETGITNENVQKFNAALETMCSEIDATFMPVSDAFRDNTGALPEGVAHDGIHFGYDLCKVWAGDMSAYIGENLTEPMAGTTESVSESVETATEETTGSEKYLTDDDASALEEQS